MEPLGFTIDGASTTDALRALKPDYERLQLIKGNTLLFVRIPLKLNADSRPS